MAVSIVNISKCETNFNDVILCLPYRTNSFEVSGCDGASTGALHCEDNRSLAEWIQTITSNINSLLTQMVRLGRLLCHIDVNKMCRLHR